MNTLKAAASPARKLVHYDRATSNSPKTPRNQTSRGKENAEDGGFAAVTAAALTPAKRVPILANFEEWMKMATDNKINATNSWNFALIDYFHDMSLLKEGDGVNFQKASCTLDGCVKIYTSRVDSVATETGKLLSGLADSGNKRGNKDSDDAEEEADEDGEGVKKKAKRKPQRSFEATLAPSFASLQLKKMELEFAVDPLFKKASADFDEGGAKGLLLNHLTIDATGRIVFDSSDDAKDASDDRAGDSEVFLHEEKAVQVNNDIDIASLGAKFFPDLGRLERQDICPSLKGFDLGDTTNSLELPFLKAPDDWRQDAKDSHIGGLGDQTGIFLDGDNVAGFEDDDDLLGGFDGDLDAAFGNGGEDWVKQAALDPNTHVKNVEFDELNGEEGVEGIGAGAFNPDDGVFVPKLQRGLSNMGEEDILNYFDRTLQKNWAGPEHWRIRKLKDSTKPQQPTNPRRKEKETFKIDFAAPLDPHLSDLIYTPAASNAAISLPKAQWRSKTRNLLPDDKHFNSKQLLRLFLKPKARMSSRRQGFGRVKPLQPDDVPHDEMDGAFWAKRQMNLNKESQVDEAAVANYDANFFQDDGAGLPDGFDDDGFAEAKEHLSQDAGIANGDGGPNGASGTAETQEGAFGTQLVTQSRRLRPEYVQYARVAKKVDVRRLKEEMWKGLRLEEVWPFRSSPPIQTNDVCSHHPRRWTYKVHKPCRNL